MICRFNKAQLERARLDSLEKVVAVMQSENEAEIEVGVLEFPEKFSLKLDSDTMILVWDAEKKTYSGLSNPELEPEPESKIDTVDLPSMEPQAEIDPIELAKRTYVMVNDNMRMSPEQRVVYNEAYNELWMKHKKDS